MKWTTEKPTKPGWYWYRDDRTVEAEPAKVYRLKSKKLYAMLTGDMEAYSACALPGEWAGPIEEPED